MPLTKIDKKARKRVLDMLAKGASQEEVAVNFGASRRTIQRIVAESRKPNPPVRPLSSSLPDDDDDLPTTEESAARKALESYAKQLVKIDRYLEGISPRIEQELAGTHSQHLKNYVTAQAIWIDKLETVTKEITRLHKNYGSKKKIIPSFRTKVVHLRDVSEDEDTEKKEVS